MTTEHFLGLQVSRLLDGMAEHGCTHLCEVETDLGQTALLLNEAIAKLGASFMAIHATVSAQLELQNLLFAGMPLTADAVAEVRALQTRIDTHVNAAVTALQFQDMTSQLIERTVSHVAGLRDMLAALGKRASTLDAHSDIGAIVEVLVNANNALDQRNATLEQVFRRPVKQTHMESGDIELF